MVLASGTPNASAIAPRIADLVAIRNAIATAGTATSR
jgi:hypothetical protein